ncbi:hypothetical protein GA0116948_108131 [Chitinophaga costaii]|uniref:Uncharacterized protein n=1 Tax=Chitinophaga costaii TaxID=1335309 RepID=A0A1C4EHX2_9BACT|nr:hypothetical protein [Chitinophaga costaii]PUZ23807.1 hypothetical protein DCM91_13500 [Chitinophaga costaii]SCC43238.1 hypothetical protein GA0116948_108131 [Chitinophaga costaii]
MSNLKDGGYIIIGVREDVFNFFAEGVSEANINSYKVDIMKDQMLKYTDPAVEIKVSYPMDICRDKSNVIQRNPGFF